MVMGWVCLTAGYLSRWHGLVGSWLAMGPSLGFTRKGEGEGEGEDGQRETALVFSSNTSVALEHASRLLICSIALSALQEKIDNHKFSYGFPNTPRDSSYAASRCLHGRRKSTIRILTMLTMPPI